MNQLTPITSLRPPDEADPTQYEKDFVVWIDQQLALLRARQFDQLDLPNVIEEFEAMGSSERRELASRLHVLIVHLLKCEFQPERKSRSWVSTIIEQRAAIERHLEQSPSLRQHVGRYASQAYKSAVALAASQTGIEKRAFPADIPYTPQQLLDPEFLP